jgi:general nucleoside transport system permease protein
VNPFDTQLLAAAIVATNPILVTALGELVAQRAGVIDIGLEGMMLAGAFWGFWCAWASRSLLLGVLGGVAAGALFGIVMAALAINARAEQIVVGLGLNILAGGMTTFGNATIFTSQVTIRPMTPFGVPMLDHLPIIGAALFDQVPVDYVPLLLLPAIWYVLYRTNWGLVIRACGEAPEAVQTAGVRVARVRWLATVFAGAMAGLGGTMLSVGNLGLFTDQMTAGRGLIALAAVIFGRWRPLPVLGACLIFGGTDALQLRLQPLPAIPREVWLALLAIGLGLLICSLHRRRIAEVGPGRLAVATSILLAGVTLVIVAPRWSVPSEFWLMLPYLITLIALAAPSGGGRMPSALGTPFPPTSGA